MGNTAFVNGKIYVDKGVFENAVLCVDGTFSRVGGNEEIITAAKAADAVIIDLNGKTVIPGLNDSHMHMFMKGTEMLQVDTSAPNSIDALVESCKKYMKEHPERCARGLSSTGWNQDKFTEGERRMPDRYDLDRISADVPIVLARVCGHVVSVNSKVIELLGLGKNPKQPENGTILLDGNGYPNGIFTEQYGEKAEELVPPPTKEELAEAFLAAQNYALSRGLTSIQSNDVGQCTYTIDEVFEIIHKIYDSGKGKIRYRHQVCVKDAEELEYYIKNEYTKGRYDNRDLLDIGPLKLFRDGSLGGRTALLRHDYLDDPGNRGVETINTENYDRICRIASDAGMQIITHTIGDGAIENVVESYERISGDGNRQRNGIVHCQITDRKLLERIARDDLLIMYQPVFLDYDMHIVGERCGEELASTSYAFNTALKLGIKVSFGTDSPVEDCDPMANIYHAVTRLDKNGYPDGGFYPDECVSVEDAIDAYTAGSAYNEFKEDRKGRIKPGYLADMVVLDTDIFTCESKKIKDINPLMTIVGGEILYKAEN